MFDWKNSIREERGEELLEKEDKKVEVIKEVKIEEVANRDKKLKANLNPLAAAAETLRSYYNNRPPIKPVPVPP